MKAKIYDYYYSAAHYAHVKAINSQMIDKSECKPDTFINGIPYTEMIQKGKTPHTSHFGDIKKVHTGTSDNITYRTH